MESADDLLWPAGSLGRRCDDRDGGKSRESAQSYTRGTSRSDHNDVDLSARYIAAISFGGCEHLVAALGKLRGQARRGRSLVAAGRNGATTF